jgi:Ca2+-binding EF-hand superfamily protein
MEVSKESLEAIFNSVDLEGSGYLGADGLVSVMNEIGEQLGVD